MSMSVQHCDPFVMVVLLDGIRECFASYSLHSSFIATFSVISGAAHAM